MNAPPALSIHNSKAEHAFIEPSFVLDIASLSFTKKKNFNGLSFCFSFFPSFFCTAASLYIHINNITTTIGTDEN